MIHLIALETNMWDVAQRVGTPSLSVIATIYVMRYLGKKEVPLNGNGNGKADAKEMGGILADIENLKESYNQVRLGMSENQERIAELSGNLNQMGVQLAQLVARRK